MAPPLAPRAEASLPPACIVCDASAPRYLIRQAGYDLWRCRACGFVFTAPPPTAEALAAFYKGFYYNHRESVSSPDTVELAKEAMRRKLEVVRGFAGLAPDARVLDIGCGCGYFLVGARAAGCEVIGIELDSQAAAFGARTFGLTIHTQPVEECPLEPGSFDVVQLRQVLEHLPYPARSLARILELLKPGGVLIVEVPNGRSPQHVLNRFFLDALIHLKNDMPELSAGRRLWLALTRPWGYAAPPMHLSGFTRSTLCRLLARQGFRVRRTGTGQMGDTVYRPCAEEYTAQAVNHEQAARQRLRQRAPLKYAAFWLFVQPAMALVWGWMHLTRQGVVLYAYAQKLADGTDGAGR